MMGMGALYWVFVVWISIYLMFSVVYTVIPLLKRKPRRGKRGRKGKNQGISIVVPAYNEEKTFKFSIPGLQKLDYENYEVIIVNDGSKDNSMEVLHSILDLEKVDKKIDSVLSHQPIKSVYRSKTHPNFIVIDKVNGGRADALNAGTVLASNEIIVFTDADSVLRPDSLSIIDEAFVEENIAGAGGTIRILQSSDGRRKLHRLPFLVRVQTMAYIRCFLQVRWSFAVLGTVPLISGAFGIYRRDLLIELGGHNVDTVGEDMDLTFRAHSLAKKQRKKIIFLPDAVCYTECPETWRILFNQRVRWQKGFMDCFIRHKGLFFHRKPLLTFFVWFQGLFVETVTPIATLLFTPVILFLIPMWFRGMVTVDIVVAAMSFIQSIAAVAVNARFGYGLGFVGNLTAIYTLFLEIIISPLANAIFTICGTSMYFINRHSWGVMERTGHDYGETLGV